MTGAPATVPVAARLPAAVHRAVDRLVGALSPVRVMLYGSYARGMTRAGSDVDLLVVLDVPEVTPAVLRRARQLVASAFPTIDIVVATADEVALAASQPSPFLASVLETGASLYERPRFLRCAVVTSTTG